MKFLLFLLLIFSSMSAYSNSKIEIVNPSLKMPGPGQDVSAIFLKFINKSPKDFKLIKASGDFAENFELHSMEMNNNMMRMRQVDSILLKNDTSTELKSGGYHIMVFGIKKLLKLNENLQLKLYFDDKSVQEIRVKVIENT
jgi:copper(I)-binding protein